MKLPARVYSCVAVAAVLVATTKKPLPEIDRSVGEEVEVGQALGGDVLGDQGADTRRGIGGQAVAC